jgi:uncharacterized protein (TIGR03083 family)
MDAATDVWNEVDKARRELADLLDGLSADQWAAKSLCTEWTVRDVVGHLTLDVRLAKVFPGVIKNGFSFDKWMCKASKHSGEREPADLVASLRTLIGTRRTPPFTKPADVLTDTVVHTQDIRRPLHLDGNAPTDRLVEIAEFIKDHRFYKTAKKRDGLALKATDAAWSVGAGAPVEGTIEALVMALMGRTAALDDLHGEGVATLRSRIASL